MYLARLLENSGYEAAVASDGAQALSLLSNLRFDLVLMDVRMPVLDGIQAARLIRSWNGPLSNIPIIATTSCVMAGDKERFFAAGMDAYLPKPLGIDQLRDAIEYLVASKGCVGRPGESVQSSAHRLA
jgi:CheY-like chemotaxis protein